MKTGIDTLANSSTVTTVGNALLLHRRMVIRRVLLLLAMFLLTVVLFLIDLSVGASGLTFSEVAFGLLNPGKLGPIDYVIIWDVRLPATVMALLVGTALAVAGAEMQTVLDNPLASPFTLGVSSAAALGAALGIVSGASFPFLPTDWLISFNAFVCALISVFLLQFMSKLRGGGTDTLVLFGIAMVFSLNALISLIQFYASAQTLQQMVFWMMGSLQRTEWAQVGILAGVVFIIFPIALRQASKMTALLMGEERAQSFGVDVRTMRNMALLRVSILTGTAVAFVGTIGFIGLIGPHIARLLVGQDQRFLLPASVLSGAAVMLGSSIVSKVLVPGIAVPIGIVTAIVGVPVFLALVFGRRPEA